MTLEEIKAQVAKEYGFYNWDSITALDLGDRIINQIAQRYAQSQTQELQEQYAELVEMLSKLVLLLEEIDSTLFHHNHSIDGWHLNGDLEPIMNFVNDMDLEPITEAKEILTKYNHLNKKP